MAWQLIERKTHRSGGFAGFRCSICMDKDRPRAILILGSDLLAALKVKHGEHVDIAYDMQAMKLGLSKGTADTGFRVSGVHKAGRIGFSLQASGVFKLIVNIQKKILPFQMEGKTAVIDCKGSQ